MHENMKTSMWHTGRSERTCRLPACHLFTRSTVSSISLNTTTYIMPPLTRPVWRHNLTADFNSLADRTVRL